MTEELKKLKSIAEIKRSIVETFPEAPAGVQFHPGEVILLVGVNGSGKTTTAARLAWLAKSKGVSVVLGAADTFRAGAAEQLIEWAKKIGVEVVSKAHASDPASVVYEALGAAKRSNAMTIIDSAGRMHTKVPLMHELEKIGKAAQKAAPESTLKTLLVVDGHVGQNAISQAKEFSDSLRIDGMILTKMDGFARGGFALKVWKELKIPILFLGVGETLEGLIRFDPNDYVARLLDP